MLFIIVLNLIASATSKFMIDSFPNINVNKNVNSGDGTHFSLSASSVDPYNSIPNWNVNYNPDDGNKKLYSYPSASGLPPVIQSYFGEPMDYISDDQNWNVNINRGDGTNFVSYSKTPGKPAVVYSNVGDRMGHSLFDPNSIVNINGNAGGYNHFSYADSGMEDSPEYMNPMTGFAPINNMFKSINPFNNNYNHMKVVHKTKKISKPRYHGYHNTKYYTSKKPYINNGYNYDMDSMMPPIVNAAKKRVYKKVNRWLSNV